MPIWPVSFVDGSYQVADADGALYPITMAQNPVSQLNPGWTPRGLQTGLAPFHILEMTHVDGYETFWLLDSALDYRSNAVLHLHPDDRAAFNAHVDTLVRNLFDEAVKMPHAAIPAAAHDFDGFLPSSVMELIRHSVAVAIGSPEVVAASSLAALGASYGRGATTLPIVWIEQVMQAPVSPGGATLSVPGPRGGTIAAQERLELPAHACFRFLDRISGLVFYLLVGQSEADRHLYLPSMSVVFTAGLANSAHDPLLLLLVYYATHTGRAVMLPEAEGLEPGLVHTVPPPQAGLDEPSAPATEATRTIHEEPLTPFGEAANHVPRSHEADAAGTEPAAPPAEETPPRPWRQAEPEQAGPSNENSVIPELPEQLPPPPETARVPAAAEPAISAWRGRPAEAPGATVAEAPRRTGAAASMPRQNWWQRLLGLGQD